MNRHRTPMRGYLAVVSIPTAAAVNLCLSSTMPLQPGPFCAALRPAHISRHVLLFMLATLAVHRATGNAVAKPPERH
jgi:hypothetical protein